MSPSVDDARPAAPFRDGWVALCLGALARGYLLLVLALTAIAVIPLVLGWHGSVVQSGSMRPHIDSGDVVVSAPLPSDSPVPLGGVVEFRSPAAAEPSGEERLRLHRIVAEGDGQGEWITAGDANAQPDSTPITREDITGQARLLVPWVGLPSFWLDHDHLGRLALWLVGTTAALGVSIWWRGGRRPPGAADEDGRDGSTSEVSDPGRRSVLMLVAVLTLGGATMLTRDRAYAGFTARTMSAASTFRVATWPTFSLGRTASYAIIAAWSIVNEPLFDLGTSVRGSVAVSPGVLVRGFWPWSITGEIDRNNTAARNARDDAGALLEVIEERPTTGVLPTNLSGVLTPGTYRRAGAVRVRNVLTFDARGDASAVFVVAGSSITFTQGTTVVLRGGASPDRVFFTSASTITVAADSQVRGVLLARADISLDRSALTGRAFTLNGSVALMRTIVTQP